MAHMAITYARRRKKAITHECTCALRDYVCRRSSQKHMWRTN